MPLILSGSIPNENVENLFPVAITINHILPSSCTCLGSSMHRSRSSTSRPSTSRPVPYSSNRSSRTEQAGQVRQARAVYNPAVIHGREVKAVQQEQTYADSICKLCSEENHDIHHHHFGTEAVRDLARAHQGGYKYHCVMCKGDESVIHPSTRKLILTDSSLYNVWTDGSLMMEVHVDMESIVGGRVRDMTRALIMQYLNHPERLEIIVLAGINNIGAGQPVAEILEEFNELREVVKAHSTMSGHSEPSVVSICTVLYAPKFCSLDVPRNFPNWVPPKGFLNRRHDIECLNAGIAAINKAEQVNYLNLHYEGIKINKSDHTKMHKHNPAEPVWRETEVRKKLHLTAKNKTKVVRKLDRIFKGGLRNLGNWERS